MADRFVLKQFAGSATNNGAFGAAQATGAGVQPVANIKDVQSLNAFEQGWNSATLTADKLPALEEMQGLEALLCKAIKENYSEGIPLWISGETYYQDSRAVYNGKVYRNKTGSYTANNPATDTANWELDKPDTAGTADKLGSSNVGSSTQPMYLSSGTATASTATVGTATKPVYLSGGTFTQGDELAKIDLSNINASGEQVVKNLISANFANTDLSNLTSAGEAHFCNPALTNSPYTTNRILEIPQDIKLELNNGTLTLKAGSKIYNGNGLITTIDADMSRPSAGINDAVFIMYIPSLNSLGSAYMTGESVSSLPTPTTSYKLYYNTSDGKCYIDGGTWIETSFPLAIATSTTTQFVSIDKVFNGFGYIGSTVFALPGVKYEFPNGFNEDGSYKSTIYTHNKVSVTTITVSGAQSLGLILFDNGSLSYAGTLEYNPNTNHNRYDRTTDYLGGILGRVYAFDTKIYDAVFSQVDSVVNSNASNFSQAGRSYLSGLGMPGNRYLDLTLGASEATYRAPANGWFFFAKRASAPGQYFNVTYDHPLSSAFFSDDAAGGAGNICGHCVPVAKGQIVRISYNTGGATVVCRFVYAEGYQ